MAATHYFTVFCCYMAAASAHAALTVYVNKAELATTTGAWFKRQTAAFGKPKTCVVQNGVTSRERWSWGMMQTQSVKGECKNEQSF